VIRTLDSALYRASLSALGFAPVSLDVKELVRAVASGEVDAQENPLTNLVNFGLWRHHPHVSLTGHFFGVLLLVCHARWFDGLTTAQQQAVQAAARQASLAQRELAAAEDAKAMAFLTEQGVQIIQPQDIALNAMRERCAEVLAQASREFPRELMTAYLRR
jgi:TRAP-type transport system periplasmic protein